MLRKIIEMLTGGPQVPGPRCEYVDLLDGQCSEKAKFRCVTCGIKLCDVDAHVSPFAGPGELRDSRYCFDCKLALEEKLHQAAVTRLLNRRKL